MAEQAVPGAETRLEEIGCMRAGQRPIDGGSGPMQLRNIPIAKPSIASYVTN